ncbi:MAG: hypothetical protein WCF36_05470 [Candidatus Nanopelagicales bacterium]
MPRTPMGDVLELGGVDLVPVGLAGTATTKPCSGCSAWAAANISTVGWNRVRGPQASPTTSHPSAVRMLR